MPFANFYLSLHSWWDFHCCCCCCYSDSDSDNESFYGTIEKPMDIKQPIDNAEDGKNTSVNAHRWHTRQSSVLIRVYVLCVDYGEDDDDDDEEDYLKPDGDCSQQSAGDATTHTHSRALFSSLKQLHKPTLPLGWRKPRVVTISVYISSKNRCTPPSVQWYVDGW